MDNSQPMEIQIHYTTFNEDRPEQQFENKQLERTLREVPYLQIKSQETLKLDYDDEELPPGFLQPYSHQDESFLSLRARNAEESMFFHVSKRGKKIQKINKCGHEDKPHYAKDMCRSCYSKYGRTKKPWKCNHERLYAQGLCQSCYTNTYNHMKRIAQSSSP